MAVNLLNEIYMQMCEASSKNSKPYPERRAIAEHTTTFYKTNTLGEGMNPIILPPAMDK